MAEDQHDDGNRNTTPQIFGGHFEIKTLKREIQIYGQNAITKLVITFEQIRSQEGQREAITRQAQQFVFPFSEDKNLTYFRVEYISREGARIQTLETELKDKKYAKEEVHQKAVTDKKIGAMATREIRSDECRIEMGNKPDDTKYIVVQLNYFETLKTEYRSDERVFTLTVPRHNKRLVADNEQNVSQIFDTSRWIDEIEIIEPRPSNTSEDPTYKILKIESDNKRWQTKDSIDNNEDIQGRKWTFREIERSENTEDQNGEVQPAPQIGQVKNDLELRFFMVKNVAPAINIEYLNGSELEAIVSLELSEENIRQQLTNITNEPQQDLYGDESMEYESNDTPRSPVLSTQPMEYVFLIDCGRSMRGTFMDSTKRTMETIMKSFDPGWKVLFCQFGSQVDSQHEFQPRQNGHVAEDGMRDANWITIDEEDSEQTIDTIISGFKAGFGSQTLRAPLVDIFHLRRNPRVFRNVIIFTDGAVPNSEVGEIHRLARTEAINQEGYLRFFVVGIGSGANRNLCDGIAKYGRGSNYYVLYDDRIQAKAYLILEEASRPSIFLQRIALPSTLDRLGYSVPIELDMSIFEVKRIYLRLKSNNQISVYQNLQQAVRNGSFSLTINGTRVPMQISQDDMQVWYSGVLKLAAFWAKQEINYLEDYDMNAERKKAIQVDASINGGFLSSKHTALVGVMDGVVGQRPQNTQPRIHELHEGYNTLNGNDEISRNSGYIPTSGGPFGQPPASGGLGGGVSGSDEGSPNPGSQHPPPQAGEIVGPPPMAGGLGGRPPMAGGLGGQSPKAGASAGVKEEMSKSKEETEKLPNFDKLMSLVKWNGLWPALEFEDVLGCLMKYNKNFKKSFEDFQNRIEAVDLILTLLVLAALEKYEITKQIEWVRISMKGKTKLAAKNIDADAEIKALLKIL